MRSAICLFGVVSGENKKDCVGNKVDYEMCFKSYDKYIIKPNNSDVFIHSWSVHLEKDVIKLYSPKKYYFEEQIKFDTKKLKNPMDCQRNLSKTYSIKKVLKLKSDYENENNFIYDCVMIIRFDIIFFVDLIFKNYDMKYLNLGYYNDPIRKHAKTKEILPANRINHSDIKKQLQDLFFFSSSKNMDKLGTLHDGLKNKVYDPWSHHRSIWFHVKKNFGKIEDNVRYTLYRSFDYELYRYIILNELDERVS